jgi:ribonuclease P protein component
VKRKNRLTRSADFLRVKKSGKSFTHPSIVLITMPNQLGTTRVAIAAGRSVGNAVRRNRAKRQIRSCIDGIFKAISPGWDMIIYARKPISSVTFDAIRQDVILVLQEARLIPRDQKNDHGTWLFG